MLRLGQIFSFIVVVLLSCNASAQVDKLSATSFKEKLKTEQNAQLLDVRTPEEFENGHLENAQNIDWNGKEFESQLSSLNKNEPIYVYCQGGGRSAAASKKLASLGFTQVYDMDGGIMAWRSAGFTEANKEKPKNGGMDMNAYKELLKSDKLVLIDFYADWCAPCKKMKPFLDKIAKDKKMNVEIVRINADEHSELATALNIDGLPYLKLYKNEEQVWEHKGFIDEKDLRIKLSK